MTAAWCGSTSAGELGVEVLTSPVSQSWRGLCPPCLITAWCTLSPVSCHGIARLMSPVFRSHGAGNVPRVSSQRGAVDIPVSWSRRGAVNGPRVSSQLAHHLCLANVVWPFLAGSS